MAKLLVILSFLWLGLADRPALAADLFRPEQTLSLVADHHAAKPGDIVTVIVYENSSASNSTDTSSQKNAGVKATLSTQRGRVEGAQLGVGDDFGAGGRVQRSGRLLAQLSVTVNGVMANGDLLVSGEQAININGEKTNIRIKGRVRAQDIGDDNTVASNRLADAQIDYVGDGYLTERSRPGLVTRVMNWLGLW